jgi:hypothetical protein
MSLIELEQAIAGLPEKEFSKLAEWFEEYLAEKWDRQIEADAKSGRLDHLAKKADDAFEKDECIPL